MKGAGGQNGIVEKIMDVCIFEFKESSSFDVHLKSNQIPSCHKKISFGPVNGTTKK